MLRSFVLWLILGVVCAFSSQAHATQGQYDQNLMNEARSYFKIGYVLHKEGLDVLALEAFKKSHALLLQAGGEQGIPPHIDLDDTLQAYYNKLFFPQPDPPDMSTQMIYPSKSHWSGTQFAKFILQQDVSASIERYTTKSRNHFIASFRRSQQFLPIIRQEFAIHGIPFELAYTALVESGFDTTVLSHAGARGMWQFMPATARIYGLKVSSDIDERLDPVKSTKAAAMYLKKLYNQFQNWPLALAAYNCGETRVAKALKTHNATTFWELLQYKALPKETRQYVPRVIAAAIISQNLPKYGITLQ